jgi:two-component system, NarL family, response regulator
VNCNPESIRVLVVDDHPLIREGIGALIRTQPDLQLVAEASTGRQGVEEFRRHVPDVTLMDMQMPDMDGVEAITAIRAEFPKARIIVLTTYAGDVLAVRALKAGAQAYLLKNDVRKDLMDRIRAVHVGQKQIHSLVANGIAHHSADDDLTRREVQVLSLVAAGHSNRRIADHLSIAHETVKVHVSSIMSKLSVSGRTHAVTRALQRGIIHL